MKKVIFTLMICGLMAVAAAAQTPNPPPRNTAPASNAGAAPTGGTGAEGKLAIVFFGAFREGIGEMKIKLDALNAEFEPKNKEMQALRDRVQNLNNQIQTQGGTVQPAVRNQWAEEATEKDKLLKRMVEDLDVLAKKRFDEVASPVQEKILKFLDNYCQQRQIVIVFEGSALQQTNMILFASQATNITEDFMKEYNKANPSGAPAPTTSKK
jgi:Skp family chaperone for outer membrane proteins